MGRVSSQWSILGVGGVSGGAIFGGSYNLYLLRNDQHGEMHLMVFGAAGWTLGASAGGRARGIGTVIDMVNKKGLSAGDPNGWSALNVQIEFAASDLHLAPGFEEGFGGSIIIGYQSLRLSAVYDTGNNLYYFNRSDASGMQVGGVGISIFSRTGLWSHNRQLI